MPFLAALLVLLLLVLSGPTPAPAYVGGGCFCPPNVKNYKGTLCYGASCPGVPACATSWGCQYWVDGNMNYVPTFALDPPLMCTPGGQPCTDMIVNGTDGNRMKCNVEYFSFVGPDGRWDYDVNNPLGETCFASSTVFPPPVLQITKDHLNAAATTITALGAAVALFTCGDARCTATIQSVGRWMAAFGAGIKFLALDPPDPNFMVYAKKNIQPTDVYTEVPGIISVEQAKMLTKIVARMEFLRAAHKAAAKTVDRIAGARAASPPNMEWYNRQTLYLEQLKFEIEQNLTTLITQQGKLAGLPLGGFPLGPRNKIAKKPIAVETGLRDTILLQFVAP